MGWGNLSAHKWRSLNCPPGRKGLTAELEFARPDGDRCGEKALDAMYCLEEAKRGGGVERTGTIVAKAYRDAVMKRHAGLVKV